MAVGIFSKLKQALKNFATDPLGNIKKAVTWVNNSVVKPVIKSGFGSLIPGIKYIEAGSDIADRVLSDGDKTDNYKAMHNLVDVGKDILNKRIRIK